MPGLTKAPSRHLLHNRSIDLACYEREDGLMDVEGHLTDHKPFDLVLSKGRTKVAGEAIHDMRLRLTFNEEMEIVAVNGIAHRLGEGIFFFEGTAYMNHFRHAHTHLFIWKWGEWGQPRPLLVNHETINREIWKPRPLGPCSRFR